MLYSGNERRMSNIPRRERRSLLQKDDTGRRIDQDISG